LPTTTTNVIVKTGHDIVKMAVQNSLLPLLIGFLERQVVQEK